MTEANAAAPAVPQMPQEQIDASMKADVDGGLYDFNTMNQLRARDGMAPLVAWTSSGVTPSPGNLGGGDAPGNPGDALATEGLYQGGGNFDWSSSDRVRAEQMVEWMKADGVPQADIDAYKRQVGMPVRSENRPWR